MQMQRNEREGLRELPVRRPAAGHALARLDPDLPLAGETIEGRSHKTRRSLLPTVTPKVIQPAEALSRVVAISEEGRTEHSESDRELGSTRSGVSEGRAKPLESELESKVKVDSRSPVQQAAHRAETPLERSGPPVAEDVIERLLRGRSRLGPVGYARLVRPAHVTLESAASSDSIVPDDADAPSTPRMSQRTERSSRPTGWAGARVPPSAAAQLQLQRALSASSVFEASLEELLRSPELARAAASMAGAEIRGAREHRAVRSNTSAGVRVGRYVARTVDGRFVSSNWTREKSDPLNLSRSTETSPGPSGRTSQGARGRSRPRELAPEGLFLEPGSKVSATTESPELETSMYPQERRGSPAAVARPWGRPRTGYAETLGAVQGGRSESSLPVWARRASGEPLVRDTESVPASGPKGELIQSLARASSPEEVIRLMVDRGATSPSLQTTLSAPVLQVIEQIRTEAYRSEEASHQPAGKGVGTRQVRRGETPRSTSRIVRGFTSLSPRQQGSGGASASQISKLAQRLQSLISTAEGSGNQGAARRQVRMAEDSAAAKSEGQGAVGDGEGQAADGQADIDALGREVLSAVTRELEMRRERRMEEDDERDFWW